MAQQGVGRRLAGLAGIGVLGALAVTAVVAQGGGRIVGGREALPGVWPFAAGIEYSSAPGARCGGTLVSERHVLTAAHCVRPMVGGQVLLFRAPELKVRVGSVAWGAGGNLYDVAAIHVHPGFEPQTLLNDIALLELSTPASEPPAAVEGVALDGRAIQPRLDVSPWGKIIGFGRIDPNSDALSDRLLEAAIPVVDTATCNDTLEGAGLKGFGSIDQRRVCAGLSQGGVDSCNGDSGGPLFVRGDGGAWVQVGVVSYGVNDCGRPGAYGVYTRAGAFRDWMLETITGVPPSAPAETPPELELGAQAAAPAVLAAAAREDGRVSVEIIGGSELRLGQPYQIKVTSSLDGYLILLDVDESNTVRQLFPNSLLDQASLPAPIQAGRILAGRPLVFPDDSYGFEIVAASVSERSRLIAVVVPEAGQVPAELAGVPPAEVLSAPEEVFRTLSVALKPAADPSGAPATWAAAQRDYVVRP